jgi:DNA modification methylase
MEINKIYNCDIREILKDMPDKSVDLILTDFPYGVGFQYQNYNDSLENLKTLINDVFPNFFRISKQIVITCGNKNMFEYPKPDWTFAWVNNAGTGQSKYGFTCWHPILYYGDYKQNKKELCRDVILNNHNNPDKTNHPCSKPLDLWIKLMKVFSNENDLIFDGFSGSGTTAIAAYHTHRNFICCELDKAYYDKSIERLKEVKNNLFENI